MKIKQIATISGKDSGTVVVRMIEEGFKFDNIFYSDTGMEFEEMYDWLRRVEKYIKQPITIVKPEKTWDEMFYGFVSRGASKGRLRGFPYIIQNGCWAQRDIKVKALKREQGKGNTIYIGIAADEAHRSARVDYHTSGNDYKFPLIDWGMKEADCFRYLKDRGLHNPLYDRFDRLGCWCCPKQKEDSLYNLWLYYPKKWEQLKIYEWNSPHGFKPDGFARLYGKNKLPMLEPRFEKRKWYEEHQVKVFV